MGDLILSIGLSKRSATVPFLKSLLVQRDVLDSSLNGSSTYRADLAAYALRLTEIPEAQKTIAGWNYRSDEKAISQLVEFLKR